MTNNSESPYTVADLFLEALDLNPSIIEAYIRRQNENKAFPRMLLFIHEFVAISAADGYARITGRPHCVIVHVDVGTAALGQGLHNSSSGKALILIFAGQAPFKLYGELAGSRLEHLQWYQDVSTQGGIVAPYSRYSNEIKAAEHVQMMVNRALLMASTGCRGPAYLTATREVLAAVVDPQVVAQQNKIIPSCVVSELSDKAVKDISSTLLTTEKPLIITGYLGRSHDAVRHLIQLADLSGLQVLDSECREMSFPANHPSWLT